MAYHLGATINILTIVTLGKLNIKHLDLKQYFHKVLLAISKCWWQTVNIVHTYNVKTDRDLSNVETALCVYINLFYLYIFTTRTESRKEERSAMIPSILYESEKLYFHLHIYIATYTQVKTKAWIILQKQQWTVLKVVYMYNTLKSIGT